MANARGKNKARNRRRTKKTSAGLVGAKRHPLSEVEKVLVGKGLYRSFAPIGSRR